MKISTTNRRPFGALGLRVPPIVFGTAALGNVPHVIPEQRKLAICGEWFRHVEPPVFIDVAYHGGDGSVLDVLRRMLQRIDVASNEVIINLTLEMAVLPEVGRRRELILQNWEESCRLLGAEYRPQLASICKADEYLAAAQSAADRERRLQDIVTGCGALAELKAAGALAGVGIVVRDWRIASELVDAVKADWVGLAGCFTLMRRPPEALDFMASLASRQMPIIVSRVFNGGFMVGGNCLDGRIVNADDPVNRSLFAWRKAFAALCHGHGVTPAHACIQFALSAPGVVAVELNSSHPDRVAENVESVVQKVPDAFWASMKEEGLLAAERPFGA